jgi:GntR family transcriptional regulator
VELSRVLAVDGVPRILVHTSIPENLVPGLDQISLHMRSLYETLQRRYGFVFRRADRWLESITPSEEEARLLEVPPTTPLLSIESCSYSPEGRPLEHYLAIYRTDQARLHIRVG